MLWFFERENNWNSNHTLLHKRKHDTKNPFVLSYINPITTVGYTEVRVDSDLRSSEIYHSFHLRKSPHWRKIRIYFRCLPNHPNLSGLVAYTTGPLCIVTPLFRTSLYAWLFKHHWYLNSNWALEFAYQISQGLNELRKCNILHNNLAPEHILIQQDSSQSGSWNCVISGFGLAQQIGKTYSDIILKISSCKKIMRVCGPHVRNVFNDIICTICTIYFKRGFICLWD